ncbi:MAG TPA: M1 family metallopeptidase [Chthonomonadaceae bacterium]|nr:M1 family metallopeptidase [Chthonomonadaceae bacterium]
MEIDRMQAEIREYLSRLPETIEATRSIHFKQGRHMKFRMALAAAALFLAGTAQAQIKHNYDLLDVNWSLSFNEQDGTIAGDVTNTLKPTEDGVGQIALNEGKLDIHDLSVNGQPAHWSVDKEQLVIDLPQPVNNGTVLKVRIVYSGKPEAGVYFTSPRRAFPAHTGMVYTQGEAEDTRYWLPTYDEPDDKATSEARITVPHGYFALSNGKLLEVVHQGDTDVYHWKMDQPFSTYLISFVAGSYDKGHESWGDLPVDYYVPTGLDSWGQAAFGGTAEKVQFYSELTGVRYPYAKFAQSAVGDFPFGGMENITAVTQTIGALFPPKEAPLDNSSGLVLHELAHQWFGDLVTCRDWSHIWLNEGFATFLPHFWYRKHEGEDAYELGRMRTMQAAARSMEYAHRPMINTHYNVPMDNFDGNAYAGGAGRLFVLQSLLGEDVFWRGVKTYLETFAYKNATTEDFFNVMGQVSGRDLDSFRKQWFYQAGVPDLTVSRAGSRLTVTQNEPLFDLDLDVWSLVGSQWEKRTLSLTGKEATLDLGHAADKPFLVDPLGKYVALIHYAQAPTADDVYAMVTHAPNAAVKAQLVTVSEQVKDRPQLAWRLFDVETSKTFKEEWAGDLASDKTEALLRLTHDSDLEIAQDAVRTLGYGASSPAVVARLRDIWHNDPRDNMRNTALNALLTLTKNLSLFDEAERTDSYNDSFRITALRFMTQNHKDQARILALDALGENSTENLRESAIGVLGELKDKPGEKTVFHALVRLLNDPGHHVKESAIYALQSYGDPAAIPSLQKLTDYSMYQIREPAKQAIATLEKK